MLFHDNKPKNAATSALSNYVKNVIALWWLLLGIFIEAIPDKDKQYWPPNEVLASTPGLVSIE